MEVRKLLEEHSKVASIAIGVVTLVAVIAIVAQLRGPAVPKAPTKAFFTADDGATYFVDSITRVAPFDYNGKQAVRALVIIGANGKTFVATLFRFSAKMKEKVDADVARDPSDPGTLLELRSGEDEIKKAMSPNAKWATVNTAAGDAAAVFQTPLDVTSPTQVAVP